MQCDRLISRVQPAFPDGRPNTTWRVSSYQPFVFKPMEICDCMSDYKWKLTTEFCSLRHKKFRVEFDALRREDKFTALLRSYQGLYRPWRGLLSPSDSPQSLPRIGRLVHQSASMDGLSGAASVMAVASLALQLANGFVQLHNFWTQVRGAPGDVDIILKDLRYLSKLLEEIHKEPDQPPVVMLGLECCRSKVTDLDKIVQEFETDFGSESRGVRVWTALKAARKKTKLKEFRESLHETKTTLILALVMVQSQQPPIYFREQGMEAIAVATGLESLSIQQPQRQVSIRSAFDPELPAYSAVPNAAFDMVDETVHDARAEFEVPQSTPNTLAQTSQFPMESAVQMAIETFMKSETFAQLMKNNHRVASVQSTCHGSYKNVSASFVGSADPGARSKSEFTGDEEDERLDARNRGSRTRVCHRTSAVGTLFGNIWIRTQTLKVEPGSSGAAASSFEIINSFIFYPSRWLTRVGFRHGMEANLSASTGGLRFDFSPVRAVPHDSRIFQYCQEGYLEGVKRMLADGHASVRDTSPKGWTPLHFAALGAKVEVCEYLIRAGADKTILAYEGLSEDALSPVTVFVETAQDIPAEQKVRMLRLFIDSLELSDPTSDGWKVIEALVQSYNKEKVPLPENSCNWLLRTLSTDGMVAFGPRTIWCGLQNAVRSFLVFEHESKILHNLLDLHPSPGSGSTVGSSHAASIAHWLALQASQRELLPMIVEAGTRLHMTGFDWIDDGVQTSPAVFGRQLPVIYSAWARAMPGGIEKADEIISSELDVTLQKAAWTRESLRESILSISGGADPNLASDHSKRCTACSDDYGAFGTGLVAPARIAFTECTATNHRFKCGCDEFLHSIGVIVAKSTSPNFTVPGTFPDEDGWTELPSMADEDLTSVGDDGWQEACKIQAEKELGNQDDDPFRASATLLYRAQGRIWLGSYESGDLLCATCFLRREEYIGKEGLGKESVFSPKPASFTM